MSGIEPVDILLVEDNPGDVRLTREALKRGRIANTLHVVGDGEAALAFLRRQEPYAAAPRPGLVLLDLNLPLLDGREVLAAIKRDPALLRIPVVVLTTSRADEDVLRSYDLHVNAYIAKPLDFAQFTAAVRVIEDFWLVLAQLPRG